MSRTTSRRAILGALATVPVAAVPALAALPAGAGEPHPDAALFALVARFVEAERLSDEAGAALDAADVACAATEPPYPDAMRRVGDAGIFLFGIHNPSSPEFYTSEECEGFRSRYLSPGHEPRFPEASLWPAQKMRAAEIVAGFDAWRAACDANEAAHGVPEAEERDRLASKLQHQIRDEVRDMRPATLAGLAAKARAWGPYDVNGRFAAAIRADLLAIGGEA